MAAAVVLCVPIILLHCTDVVVGVVEIIIITKGPDSHDQFLKRAVTLIQDQTV